MDKNISNIWIFKGILERIKILDLLWIWLFIINSIFYGYMIGHLDYSIVFFIANSVFWITFIIKYILNMIYHEKEKFKIQRLIKTWNDEKLKRLKFREDSDLYKIFKRTYIAKNILEKDIDEIRQNFNKLIPEQFIKGIWKWLWEELKIWLSVKKELHIMFIDISGFTKISENINSDKALMLLNIYFDWIVEITKKNWWYVDKFLWDWIMIIFDCKNSDNILRTSVEIIKLINKINIGKYKNRISMWIGINSGKVILWTIWSRDRMDISIIWDTVNVASRLEQLTRENENWVIFSKTTYDLLEDKNKFNINKLWKKDIKWKKEGMILYGITIQ